MPMTTMWRQTLDAGRRRCGVRAGQIAQPHQLLEDLADGQIALDAVEAAGAEDAAHAAADLGADASGAAAVVLDQHAFDHLAVVQFQQQLVRVVAGA